MQSRIKKFLMLSALLGLCWGADIGFAAGLSVDDFLPPVQAESEAQKVNLTKIQNPEDIEIVKGMDGKDAVKASNAQDAINSVAERMDKQGDEINCQMVLFPGGVGWVSRGASIYEYHEGKTATAIAQRNAYVIAYTLAKKHLADAIGELTSKGSTEFAKMLETLITSTSKDDLTNMTTGLGENTAEIASAMLRGYVVYEVEDAQQDKYGTVSVTIVTTPKTQGAFVRPDVNSIGAESIRSGLIQVLIEVENGLIPPIGGRTIFVPQTGELAYVSFGSTVIPQNSDVILQKELELTSKEIAKMRARNALVGILRGDDVYAVSGDTEDVQEMIKQFEVSSKTDPLTKKDEKMYVQLEERQKTFKSSQEYNTHISSLRNGVVPRGVIVRTFTNKEKTLVTGIAVYIPSMTAQADKAAKQMKTLSPMDDSRETSGKADTAGTGGELSFEVKGGTAPSQGPTGRVSKVEDL